MEDSKGINYANMATTPRDILIEALHPGTFQKDDDVEIFISKTNRYFDASGIQKTMRGVLVIGLIHRDLRDKYEATEKSSKNFEERFRLAFTKKRTLVQEMEAVFSFRRQKEDAEGFIKKVDSLVERLLKHSWDKETLKIPISATIGKQYEK